MAAGSELGDLVALGHTGSSHYVGLETEAIKLALLLAQFRFGTAREVLESREAQVVTA